MLTNLIFQLARQHPSKIAYIHNDDPLSYAAFARAIAATRDFLSPHALRAGDRAVVLARDLRDCWIIVLALQSMGLDTICVESIAQAAELDALDGACVVATLADQRAHDLGYHSLPGVKIAVVPPSVFDGIDAGPLPSALPDIRQGGQIVYTSGTTGRYKKVLIDNEDRIVATARSKEFDAATCYHGTNFGLWTAAGYAVSLAVWHSGGCVVTDQRADFLETLFRHPINELTLMPQDIKDLLALPDPAGAPFSGLKLTTGGGFLTLATANEVVRRIAVNLFVTYGATECYPIMRQRFSTVDDLLWLTPVEGRVVEIVDDQGQHCPVGQEGVLRVLAAAYDCRSYMDDAEASARMFRNGYFYPGDLAVRRADGRFHILGRVADVLNVQGQKIPVAPIEQHIQVRLKVPQVCVFAIQADDGSERLVIAIESQTTPPKAELDAVAKTFASFESVQFAVLPEFPRTPSGMRKADRVALRRQVSRDTPIG